MLCQPCSSGGYFCLPNVRFLLEQALALADGLVGLKASIGISDSLEYIIGSDEHEVNVRFHLLRRGETWLADDLEGYTEASWGYSTCLILRKLLQTELLQEAG